MIDLSGLADPAEVPREFAAWQRLLGDVLRTDRATAHPELADLPDPTVSRAVPRVDLLGSGTNLLPSRYVSRPVEAGIANAAELTAVTERLTRLYGMIGAGLPSFAAAGHPSRPSYVSLAELERVGALTIKSRDDTPRRGNVLLRTLGRPPTVATGTPTDDKGVAQVVEIDTDRLDPYFLAAFLRADVAALPVANTLGAVSREDLRRCRIPRMPLAEQHRYGTEFRRLAELQAALQLLADLSGKVIEQAIHGLTAGALAPGQTMTDRETAAAEGETSERCSSGPNHQRMAADIWAVADLLRGDYKRHEYGQVILPFTVLRRLDAVMAPTRAAVWARDAALNIENKEKLLERAADLSFFNVSKQNFTTIAADTTNVLIVAKNLRDYVNGFSPNVREVLDRFDFNNEITRLTEAKLIHLVVARFKDFRTWTSCPTTTWATSSST